MYWSTGLPPPRSIYGLSVERVEQHIEQHGNFRSGQRAFGIKPIQAEGGGGPAFLQVAQQVRFRFQGGVVGAQFGARIGQNLRGDHLRALLALLVLAVGARFLANLLAVPDERYSLTVLTGLLP